MDTVGSRFDHVPIVMEDVPKWESSDAPRSCRFWSLEMERDAPGKICGNKRTQYLVKMKTNINKIFLAAMVTGLAVMGLPITSSATIYNPATDFSTSVNPTGVWSYGWSQTLGAPFNIDTTVIQNLGGVNGVAQWQGNQPPGADGNPSVFKNTTASQQTISSILIPAGDLAMHPGSADQDSVIQFKAPTAGQYLISGSFFGLDQVGPTSTDIHVLVNNNALFNGVVNGYGPGTGTPPFFGLTVTLAAGGIIDFAVGDDSGSGRDAGGANFSYDSTGLAATITAVPEPTTMVAGALLFLPFGLSTVRILRRSRMA